MSLAVETTLAQESQSNAPVRRGLGLEHVNTTGLQTVAGSSRVIHGSQNVTLNIDIALAPDPFGDISEVSQQPVRGT